MIDDAIIIIGEFHDHPEIGEKIVSAIANKIGGYENMKIFYELPIVSHINGQPAIPLEPALVTEKIGSEILIKQNIPSQISDLYLLRNQILKKMHAPNQYFEDDLKERYIDILHGITPGEEREDFKKLVEPIFEEDPAFVGEDPAFVGEDEEFSDYPPDFDNPYENILDFCEIKISELLSTIEDRETHDILNELKDEDPNAFIRKLASMRDEIMVSTFLQKRVKSKMSILIVGQDHVDNLIRLLRPNVGDDIIMKLTHSQIEELLEENERRKQTAGKKKRKGKSTRRKSIRKITKKRRK